MSDLISRQAAIAHAVPLNLFGREVMIVSVSELENLPSAQADVPDTNVGDLISRQAAIDELDKGAWGVEWDKTLAKTMIESLPSAQPEPQWIPWNSGNLPEESGTYAVTAYDGAIKRVTYAKYQKRLKRWELTGARAYWRVLAWMPLPEPYKCNTVINYLYRDASNYKVQNRAVVKGLLTEEQKKQIIDSLDEGMWFIPSQVELPEERFSDISEDDHSWFELEYGFETTSEDATVELTAQELAENFAKAKDNWKLTIF